MKENRLALSFEFILLFIGIVCVYSFNEIKLSSHAHASFLVPPQDIKYFTLGYQEILADSLWIRLLQDIDLCGPGARIKNKQKGVSSQEFAKRLRDENDHSPLPLHEGNVAECENGWSAHMLDAITELAPKFKMPYIVGATILSGVVKDNVGAGIIFKKGVERFPDDWTMSYRAAFHYMAALGDYATAADYLQRAGRNGAPRWVFALAARLQTKLGQAVLAKPVLEEAIAADPNSQWAQTLKERLDNINKIIEKGE